MHGENGHELLTDLYQLTMAQGYWETGQGATQACFHAYFRDYPFRGGYAIACGMDQLAELIDGFAFSAEDVDYLASLDAPGGGRLFKPGVSGVPAHVLATRATSMPWPRAPWCSRTSRSCV